MQLKQVTVMPNCNKENMKKFKKTIVTEFILKFIYETMYNQAAMCLKWSNCCKATYHNIFLPNVEYYISHVLGSFVRPGKMVLSHPLKSVS